MDLVTSETVKATTKYTNNFTKLLEKFLVFFAHEAARSKAFFCFVVVHVVVLVVVKNNTNQSF
jgi:hypothetical protein